MDQHLIKNVNSLVNKLDAINKAYVDCIKYEAAIGIILDTVMTDHTLFTFLATKDCATGRIIICEMSVERLAYE